LELNKIYQGDSFELLKKVDDSSVDLLLTDPPYNISQKGGEEAYGGGRVGLDFGDWDYGFDIAGWLGAVIPKIKEGSGQVIIFNSYYNVELIARVLEKHGFNVHTVPLYWIKTNPIPHFPKRMPVSSMEHFVWATKGDNYVFNEEFFKGINYNRGRYEASSHEGQNERFHTTQKPLSLWNKLLKVHSNVGDVVLDTFGGSGVTAVSCTRLRRKYLVFELGEEYYEKSSSRLKRERRRPKTLWVKK